MFNHSSTHARTTVTGTSIGFLPLHLLTASIGMRLLAAGYRDPSAGTYAAGASKDMSSLTTDFRCVSG
ncbi:MAG TPA: hypothetical protein VN961_10005 [Streptosporangiaceae bacterium]|nr:hypothetical protein [Streptosporangiaceae bacterium]